MPGPVRRRPSSRLAWAPAGWLVLALAVAGCATGERWIPPTITVTGVLSGPDGAVIAPGSAIRIRLVGTGGVLDEVAFDGAETFPVPFDVKYDRESVGGVGRIEAMVIGTSGRIDWSLVDPVTIPLDGRARAVDGRMQAPRAGIGP